MRVYTVVSQQSLRHAEPGAITAEAEGYDGLMTMENAHDPFIPLAVAAVNTERITLMTAIAIAFPRSPMVVANTAWDLHEASQGRFVLGIGPQVKGHNARRFSVPWSPPAPRLREYVEALRAIWRCWRTGEKLDYRGEHYLIHPHDTPIYPAQYRAPDGADYDLGGGSSHAAALGARVRRRAIASVLHQTLHR